MKCPNCGAEMKEGHLYCEKCGEDIHIVPDFEPELELNLEQSLGNILKDVAQDGAEKEKAEAQKGKRDTRLRTFLGWVGIAALVILLIAGGIKVFQHYSLDYQIAQAKKAVVMKQYEKAVGYYTRARELDQFDVGLKLDLAEVYFLQNDKEQYEYWLNDIVADPNTDAEQLGSVYGKLIAIYRAREDYQAINDMLLKCDNEAIRSVYQSYMAEPPQFGIPEGSYTEVKALKLTVTGNGIIYYTMNGSTPDEASERYTAPILLENGYYNVKAVFVNAYGVTSEIASAEYHVSVEQLETPEINVDAGSYNIPVMITVLNNAENIYYTTDGTTPDLTSPQYTEPIPMPLGHSTFKFVRLEAGRSSVVVERTFNLELETELAPERAVDTVRENALSSGKILDDTGHFDDTAACYQYQYLYVVRLGEGQDYYVVAEVLVDVEGIPARTGNYFAIDVYTGLCYKLQIEGGNYRISSLEPSG